jgi:phage shock protein PspC (stress-responsive transcriptional regulator)
LGKEKTVVASREVEGIIKEMGPIGHESTGREEPSVEPPRRLFRIPDREILAGVCAGVAAFTNIDVTVIRLVVVIATYFTGGAVILLYLAAALLLPVARTPEEKAAAQGQRFRADDILERAKAKYADLAEESKPALTNIGELILRFTKFAGAVLAVVGTVAVVGLVAVWVASIWSLVLSGRVFGYTLDPAMSVWLVGVFVTSVIWIVLLPALGLTITMWRYARSTRGRGNVWWTVTGLVAWAVAIGLTVAIPLGSTQLRTALYDQQGHINLGARTVCVGDDVYCNRADPMTKCVHQYIDMGDTQIQALTNCDSVAPPVPTPPSPPPVPTPAI